MKKSELLRIIFEALRKETFNAYDAQIDQHLKAIIIMDDLLKAGMRPPGQATREYNEVTDEYIIKDPAWEEEDD